MLGGRMATLKVNSWIWQTAAAVVITVSIVVGLNSLPGAIRSLQTTPKKGKPVAAEADAKEFAGFYWQLIDDYDYATAYGKLTPADRKLVSKKTFVSKKAERRFSSPPKVASVVLDGKTASVTLTYNTSKGKKFTTDDVVFLNGKWYQELSVEGLIFTYDVDPRDIPKVERETVGKKFLLPGFDITLKKAARSKTIAVDPGENVSAQGDYVTVELDVANAGKKSATWRAGENAWLFDERTRVFSSLSLPGVESSSEIAPGMQASVTAVFDVPRTDTEFWLLVGSGEERRLVHLKP